MSTSDPLRLFSSESVTIGHPDKICDQVSDSILDAMLTADPNSRVAVEALTTTGLVHVAGEVTTDAELQLLVKTTASRVDDAIARIVELHPYELPECIAVETRAGLPAYLDWIRAQTREDTD